MSNNMTLQQVVNHQSLNFHLPCNVQVGEHNNIHVQNHLTNQLKEDFDWMKNQIQQLMLDNQSQAEKIQKLQSDKQGQVDKIQSHADEIQKLKSDILQHQSDKQCQAAKIQLLESRVKVVNEKTDKTLIKEKDDRITLIVEFVVYDKMTMSVSRDKTVKQVEEMVRKELRRNCHRNVVGNIYSVRQKKDIYSRYNNYSNDQSLAHYGVEDGDIVYWWEY